MTEICMIMAIGPENVIGRGNKLAWHSKQDFKHFVKKTTGWPCLFGATTFYGLPKYPLKNRLCVVVNIEAKDTELKQNANGMWIETNTLDKALEICKSYEKIFICGGKSIYMYFLENNLIDSMYLTKVNSKDGSLEKDIADNPNDFVKFPIDLDAYVKDWDHIEIVYSHDPDPENYECKFIKFTKQKAE